VFDLDGLLIDSEQAWDSARRHVTAESNGCWIASATRDMMGMSSVEWSRYLHERLGVPMGPEEISARVVERIQVLYRERLPLLPGARQSVERLAQRWPLALASSSNRPVIDLVLSLARLEPFFRVTISSEEVARGKPAPGRLPCGRQAPRGGPITLRRHRGLAQRDPGRQGRRHASRRGTEPGVPAR
jgi:beta-phosphoglucomutase-like phosphatase (HAD superfamily)